MNHKSLFPTTCARVEVTQERHNFTNTTQYICDDSHYFQTHHSHTSDDIRNGSPRFRTKAISETTAAKKTISTGFFRQTDHQNDVTFRQNELYKRLLDADCNESQDDTVIQSIEKKSTHLKRISSKPPNSKAKCAQKDATSSCSLACSPTKLCDPRQPQKLTFQHTPTYSDSLARQAGNEMGRLIVPKKKAVTRLARDLSSRAYGHTSSSFRKISDPGVVRRGKPSKKSD